jgi:hypothetical protein
VARLLRIYLQDHYAGSTAGLQLARRTARNNRGTPLGDFVATLADEIEADRRELRKVMADLEVRPNQLKSALAALAERLGRLKLNGRLLHYSPLSRLLELELLVLGLEGKRGLWTALKAAAGPSVPLDEARLDRLGARAEKQQQALERRRLEAAEAALGSEHRGR